MNIWMDGWMERWNDGQNVNLLSGGSVGELAGTKTSENKRLREIIKTKTKNSNKN